MVIDLNEPAVLDGEDDNGSLGDCNSFVDGSRGVCNSFDDGSRGDCSSFDVGSDDRDQSCESSNHVKTSKSVDHHELIKGPDESFYWVPRVSKSVFPDVNAEYDSVEECISVYKRYAAAGGFGVRKSNQKRLRSGFVKSKTLVCNREGCPKGVYLNTLDGKKGDRRIRTSNFRVCGCTARAVFTLIPNTTRYKLTTFDMEHNHQLDKPEYKHLSKAEKKLTYTEQLFIMKALNSNLGGIRTHQLYTSLKGSSTLVHGTQVEFKNFTNGVNCFIGDSDAQMLINRMEERLKYTKDFSFDYFVENAELCGMFWADEVAKCNYKEFGDIVSFDATYRTNKYKMMFIPFTAIDNHKRCVTVGAGLLKRETAEAYGWLLRAFKKALGRPPNMIVTDQDGSMLKAVAAELPGTKHRLCMWHIMYKLPRKIVSKVYDDTDFEEKFGKLVWNMYIKPAVFEIRWNNLMTEFNLVGHKWLTKMYALRELWIPAFFIDCPLCGLMRTTSRSESENSFFNYFLSPGSTLVKFMLSFESAMDRQRYNQEVLDHQSFDSFPTLLTPLPIEVHASNVYTRKLFTLVQKEIVAGSWLCSVKDMKSNDGYYECDIFEQLLDNIPVPEVIEVKVVDDEISSKDVVKEINLYQNTKRIYKVMYNEKDSSVSCSCQLFIRCGILCRHTFCVFKNCNVSRIPDEYILRRWTKDLIPPDLRNKKNRYGEKNEEFERLSIEATGIFDSCIHLLRDHPKKLASFVNKMKAVKSEFEAELPVIEGRSLAQMVEDFMGVKEPDVVNVHNPSGVPKGRKKQVRIISAREKAVVKKKKQNRQKMGCTICFSLEHTRAKCPQKDNADFVYAASLASQDATKKNNTDQTGNVLGQGIGGSNSAERGSAPIQV